MLVIISDLHLTDKSSGETINAGAFRVFVESLTNLVEQACWRKGGEFNPIDRCDVVLLGDIFDVIRSTQWLKTGRGRAAIRPWSSPDKMAPVIDKITDGIVNANKEALAHLTDLGGKITVRPDKDAQPVDIPLLIHYMVGNHDWFYHLPDSAYKPIRQKLVDAIGLDNDAGTKFPHLLSEQAALAALFEQHKLYGQHGDVYDAFNFEPDKGRDFSSLGDCIVVELLNRFPEDARRDLKVGPDDDLVVGLKEIDNVRPLLAVPGWLDGLLKRDATPQQRDTVLKTWDNQVEQFLDLPFVRERDRPWRWDTVDTLQIALYLTKSVSLRRLSRVADRIGNLINSDDYVKHALGEPALRAEPDKRANFVIYGHTHKAEAISLDIVNSGDAAREQIYFNSGTWRRVHEKCIREPKAEEFTSFHVMTFVAFYKDDERGGRKYETWSGRLG